ncbi:MAG: NAD(P)/FAD-dependent oxidoreductase [Pseudomonadota bacterium]
MKSAKIDANASIGPGRLNRRRFLQAAGAASAASIFPTAVGAQRKKADVIVIGAGLSGLHAALTMQDAGMSVLVVEAADRVGGRLLTLDGLPGRPEGGGAQVGQSYGRILSRAYQYDIGISFEARQRRGRVLAVGGKLIDAKDWATSPINPMPEQYKRIAPDAALFALGGPDNPFTDFDSWRLATGANDVSASEFLSAKGLNADALGMANKALNANALETYSMANVWRSLLLYKRDAEIGPSGAVAGGAQRLPEAMANALDEGALRLGSTVRAITGGRRGVKVETSTGVVEADFAIVALPFPALKGIDFRPGFTGAQAKAIADLPYTQIMQVHFETSRPFWESDGMAPAMWTDGPFERIFATRDRESGDVVGFNAWVNGVGAAAFAGKSDEEIGGLLSAEMMRLRPASAGETRINQVVRWTKDESYAGGAYMHWGPGQISDWADTMGASVGRIHFAGEHLSTLYTGMEGAMESGERAALDIMERAA